MNLGQSSGKSGVVIFKRGKRGIFEGSKIRFTEDVDREDDTRVGQFGANQLSRGFTDGLCGISGEILFRAAAPFGPVADNLGCFHGFALTTLKLRVSDQA